MPDPIKKTISATQAPALWNRSPWTTRWMLYKHFREGMSLEKATDARMSWGLKMEPLLLAQAAQDLALEVHANTEGYVRRGQLGCTRDAIVIDPTLGPGTLETKCVFDYRDWMANWGGGATVPDHYEIQTQEQMLVGGGDRFENFRWGVIAVWVAGDVHYFHRNPVEGLWDELIDETRVFFESVAAGEEPDPFGIAAELPMLTAVKRTGEVLDLTADIALAEEVRMFDWAKGVSRRHEKMAEASKVKLLAALGNASEAECYGGIRLKVTQSEIPGSTRKAYTRTTLTAKVPEQLPDEMMDNIKNTEAAA